MFHDQFEHVDVTFNDEHFVGPVADDAVYIVHVHHSWTTSVRLVQPHVHQQDEYAHGVVLQLQSLHVDVFLYELHGEPVE